MPGERLPGLPYYLRGKEMAGLKQRYKDLTRGIAARLDEAISAGRVDAKAFFLTLPESFPSYPLVVILEKSLTEVESTFSYHYAEVEMQFGVTASSLLPTETEEFLTDLCLDIAELFLADKQLRGLADHTRLVGLQTDSSIESSESSRRWVAVSLAWRFQFTS